MSISNSIINIRNSKCLNNKVITTKYSLISFFPLILYYQFRKIINIYYLILIAIQSFDVLSPFGPLSTALAFGFILLLSVIKEFIEDLNRYYKNVEHNNQKTLIYRRKIWEKDTWQNIKPGDFILVSNNEFVPCDLLLLAIQGSHNTCYIETSNLDGEKNLKPKHTLNNIEDYLKNNTENLEKIELKIRYIINSL